MRVRIDLRASLALLDRSGSVPKQLEFAAVEHELKTRRDPTRSTCK